MNERKDPRHTDSVLQCSPNQKFQFKNKKQKINLKISFGMVHI